MAALLERRCDGLQILDAARAVERVVGPSVEGHRARVVLLGARVRRGQLDVDVEQTHIVGECEEILFGGLADGRELLTAPPAPAHRDDADAGCHEGGDDPQRDGAARAVGAAGRSVRAG